MNPYDKVDLCELRGNANVRQLVENRRFHLETCVGQVRSRPPDSPGIPLGRGREKMWQIRRWPNRAD